MSVETERLLNLAAPILKKRANVLFFLTRGLQPQKSLDTSHIKTAGFPAARLDEGPGKFFLFFQMLPVHLI